jgi:hypothetical protein
MDIPTNGKPMNLRPHMLAAYAGDGGAKAFARDIGAGTESAKDYYGTGITPRKRVIDALRALDKKLAHRQAQIAALRADVLERLNNAQTDRAASSVASALDTGVRHSGDEVGNQETDTGKPVTSGSQHLGADHNLSRARRSPPT